jgi:hypothetical protein
MEFTATYDANDNVTLVETTWLIDGERVPHERYTVEYDSNSNPVSIEVYYYNGNDIDQMNRKAFQAYDARGNLTLSESYLWSWDSETEEIKWMGYGKQVSTYDANGNRLSDEYYDWDTSSDNWIGSYKNVYTYDANGDESSYEYYRWDTSSGGWAGGSRTTYEERNAYGDVILYHNYSWANNGWDWSTYTVYYPGGSDPNATAHVGGGEASAYIHGGVLHIRTARPERIGIYSLDGAKVYESAVPAGATTLSADRLPQGVLIVRGASGWVRKVVK